MKTSIFKTFFIAVYVICITGVANAVQQEKVIKKSYKVKPSTHIEINNKFGKVHVNTWNKNEVMVNIVIDVDGKEPERILEKINIEFDDEIGDDYLGIKTVLEDIKGKSSFSINYTIDMPKGNSLELTNKFGDTYIADLSGDLELDLGYGLLKAGNLTGNAEIKMEFGSGMSQIGSLPNAELDIKYSKLTIDDSKNLEVESQFSEVIGGNFSDVQISMKYGKFRADNIKHLNGEVQFSGIELHRLSGDVYLDLKHTQLDIRAIDDSMNEIRVDGQFSKMNITLPADLSISLNLDFQFADLKYRGEDITFKKIIKENTTKEYEGFLGKENSGRNLTVDSKYGDLSLDIQ